jgi:hypothetical protein
MSPHELSVLLAELEQNLNREVNSTSTTTDLPNYWMDWAKILGKVEVSQGDAIPKILEHQTNQNDGNRQTTELKSPPRVSTETRESKPNPAFEG